MVRCSRIHRLPTERPWSWAPFKKTPERADFPALRVIFCGSDHFSAPSFNMLRETHLRRSDIISDLKVITPVSKRSGRGMSVLKEAPLTILAKKTKYDPFHVDSFNLRPEELPPGKWDLIIAVSFGHKIGPEVLSAMTYGGLNVHPSILPRYRGPAPLHHALLNRDHETGVSIQTIHPTKFDQGDVLMQSAPISLTDMTLDHLHGKTAMIGATMLRDLLYTGYPSNAPAPLKLTLTPSQAPKIDKSAMQVDWNTWTVAKIVKWSSVFDSLWTRLDERIVKLKNIQAADREHGTGTKPGTIEILEPLGASIKRQMQVRCIDGWVSIGQVTLAGSKEHDAGDSKSLKGRIFGSIDQSKRPLCP